MSSARAREAGCDEAQPPSVSAPTSPIATMRIVLLLLMDGLPRALLHLSHWSRSQWRNAVEHQWSHARTAREDDGRPQLPFRWTCSVRSEWRDTARRSRWELRSYERLRQRSWCLHP